jgi:hypothetical protein
LAIEKSSGGLLEKTRELYNSINKYYARRILNYCLDINKAELTNLDYEGIDVDREYGQYIRINISENIPVKKIEAVKDILQETILINAK